VRRTKTVFAVVAVMAAMLVAFAAPAMADDWDWNDYGDDFYGYDDVGFLGYGSTSYDELCSPGLPDGIYVPGCIFSDPIEEDFDFDDEELVFVYDDDDDFYDDDDDDDDGFYDFYDDDDDEDDENEQEVVRVIDDD
jgi:hypothetical protein